MCGLRKELHLYFTHGDPVIIMDQATAIFKVEGLEELAKIAHFLEACLADVRRS